MSRPKKIKSKKSSNLAPKWKRLASFTIDFTLTYVLLIFGIYFGAYAAWFSVKESGLTLAEMENVVKLGSVFGLFFWAGVGLFLNYGVLQGTSGKTIGKSMLGIKVINEHGDEFGIWNSIGRTGCYLFSGLPFFFGFASVLIHRKNQGWHDQFMGTLVVDDPRKIGQNVISLPKKNKSADKKAA